METRTVIDTIRTNECGIAIRQRIIQIVRQSYLTGDRSAPAMRLTTDGGALVTQEAFTDFVSQMSSEIRELQESTAALLDTKVQA